MCEDLSLVICATHEPNEQIINNTDEVINKPVSYTHLTLPTTDRV